MGFQFTTTVTVIGSQTVVGRDKGNRPIYDTPRTESPGWVLWPQSSTEDVHSEDIATDALEGFAPPGTDVSGIQQVEVPMFPGKVFEVVGTPWPWKSPFTGLAPGVGVSLKAVT